MQCSLSCLLLLKPHPQSLSLSFLLRVSTVASSVNLPALWTPALLLTSQLQRPLCSVYGEDLVVIAVRYLSNKDDRVYAHDWSSLSWATLCSCPSLGSVHLCCLKFRGCWAITSLPLRIASSRNTPTSLCAWLIPVLHINGITQELPLGIFCDSTWLSIFKACPWCSVNQNFIFYNCWITF